MILHPAEFFSDWYQKKLVSFEAFLKQEHRPDNAVAPFQFFDKATRGKVHGSYFKISILTPVPDDKTSVIAFAVDPMRWEQLQRSIAMTEQAVFNATNGIGMHVPKVMSVCDWITQEPGGKASRLKIEYHFNDIDPWVLSLFTGKVENGAFVFDPAHSVIMPDEALPMAIDHGMQLLRAFYATSFEKAQRCVYDAMTTNAQK